MLYQKNKNKKIIRNITYSFKYFTKLFIYKIIKYNMEINQKIKLIRKYRKISQDFLSYELGISQVAYSKIERGLSKISFKDVETICNVLKISIIKLLGSDINILIKNNKNKMLNIKNYHDQIIDRYKILNKWKPILEKAIKEEWKHSILANYAEKHSYYDNMMTENLSEDDKEINNYRLLPVCFNLFKKLKCEEGQIEFDEYDLKEKIEKEFIYSTKYNPELKKINKNYSITLVSDMEHSLVDKICNFIENYIKEENKFVFQVPIISDIELLSSNFEENIMKMKLHYCLK